MARYELVERIGVGGMAEIFRGKAVAGGGFEKPVAIKRILPHLSQDKRFVELLITEAKTLSQLRHRNVVQIYDVGLGDDGQYFLVMEFVDGVDLGALYVALEKAKMRLPLEVALHLVGEVCEALDHAHRARSGDGQPLGLVHRDVTPSNILLSRSGEVKLTDFGIAKRMEEATGHGGVRGKFAYISPEQAINAHVDARSDVYSLGVVLYELVLGKRLYSHLPDFDALHTVREARALRMQEAAPDLDPELGRIVSTALAPAPSDRYASAGTFGATLRTYRYALASSIGDPALEIARLVDGHRHGSIEPAGPLKREPTVVRIATAVGFSPGFSSLDEPGGPGDLFEEELTRAMVETEMPRAGSQVRFDEHDSNTASVAVAGMELSDTETRVRSPFASISPRAGSGTALSLRDDQPEHLDTRRSERFPRASIGDIFHRRPSFSKPSSSSPGSPARRTPLDDGRMSTPRRRALIIAIAACILCAVVAFVVVGLLLVERPELRAGAVDAGVGPDARSVGIDAGTPKVEKRATPKRPKRRTPAKQPAKKKRRPKR
jgi:serine/threonine protein kinase